MSNPHRIELRKIPIEQRIVDLQFMAWNAEKTIGELQETVKAVVSKMEITTIRRAGS